ncbi:hypothetical protein J3R82DRAFT_8028 [Butyriboletus roseoflavus]|nr:hypothetical protein J3R82DRAFT_8028 [Butyriboletus roseoflavus]
MLTVGLDRAPPTEISTGSPIRAVVFTANGEFLVSGDKEAVRVWRLADNQLVGTMKAKDVRSIAVSKDNRWIVAGKSWGETTVWEFRQPFKEVFTHDDNGHTVTSVDFSPDSTRLVTASGSRAALVWDVASRKVVVGPLEHQYWVIAAKFSPQGDRIATATLLRDSVRVYNSLNGSLLADIPVKVTPYYNTGLLWPAGERIFIVSDNTIKQINASTKSVVPEWSVPADSNYSCIVSSKSGEPIIYSAGFTIMLCDSSTRTPHPLIELPQDAHSIALSPNSQFLAIGGGEGKISFKSIGIPAAP